jgi:hypothetical protein
MLSQDNVDHERRMADLGAVRGSQRRCVVCFGGAELVVESVSVSVSVSVRAQSRRQVRPLEGRTVSQVSD